VRDRGLQAGALRVNLLCTPEAQRPPGRLQLLAMTVPRRVVRSQGLTQGGLLLLQPAGGSRGTQKGAIGRLSGHTHGWFEALTAMHAPREP